VALVLTPIQLTWYVDSDTNEMTFIYLIMW